ncbi:MAG: VWA domain-containing protein [Bacillota bacterium]
MNDHVIHSLARFTALLRALGARPGAAEFLDALQALSLVEWESRREVQSALRSTLAKGPADAARFDRAFDFFFASGARREEQLKTLEVREQAEQAAREKARRELVFQGKPLGLSTSDSATYAALRPEDRIRLNEFLERTSNGLNVDQRFLPVAQKIIEGYLERWRRQLPPGSSRTSRVLGELLGSGAGQGGELLERDFRLLGEEDLPQFRLALRVLARRLASRVSRRYRRSQHKRILDFRRTARSNLRYGGAMFDLRHRARRLDRPDILLLCDVSGSMLPYAEFVSQFIRGLHDVVSRVHTFTFADELEKGPVGNGRWGGGTNLARALDQLLAVYDACLNPRTCVILVSDTKTLHGQDAAANLQLLARRVRKILWLNPLPKEQWQRLPHQAAFSRYCTMAECNNLSQLECIVKNRVFGSPCPP